MLLQHLCSQSDPQAEAQQGDRPSFQKFVGMRAGEAVPDETAICRFRQRMIAAGLHERLLDLLNEQLAAAGYLVKRTTLVDATLVESSRTRPNHQVALEGKAPDTDARYTRKGNLRYYGYKAHVSADGDNQLVCRAKITAANVDDSLVFAELIDGPTQAVYADKIYDPIKNKAWLAERGMANGILKKSHRFYPLTADDRRRNRDKSRRRQPIERSLPNLAELLLSERLHRARDYPAVELVQHRAHHAHLRGSSSSRSQVDPSLWRSGR